MHERDHPPHLSQPPHPPFVCHVCHFSSLDNSGLLQHLAVSQHCSTMMGSTCINDVGEKDDSDTNVLLDVDDASMGSSDHGHTSDGPDLVSRARSLSHMIDWYNISENDDKDDVHELDSAEEQVVPKSDAKYQYFEDQNDFPASPDDTAHVFLADLCRQIRAPLYVYDEILQWG